MRPHLQIRRPRPPVLVILAILLVILIPGWIIPAEGKALPDSGSDVIAAVNALRRANGLTPYKVNAALMFAAQKHSEYQASIGTWSHSGKNGSNPNSRAVAAGYGAGAQVFVSENVAMGQTMTAQGAVAIWQGDSLHLGTMLSPSYQDAGAGVASDGSSTYYTLDVGYVAGSAPAENVPGENSLPAAATPADTAVAVQLLSGVATTTPLADGSIVHIVAEGQVLVVIAEAYGVTLADLLSLNQLTAQSIIHPGDTLIIRAAQYTLTPTPTETVPATTPAPTRTPLPTQPPSPSPTSTPPAATATFPPPQTANQPAAVDPLLVAIVALVVLGVILVFLGSLLRRKT